MLDNFTQEHIDTVMSEKKAQENIANWQSFHQEWLAKGEQEFAQFWFEMAESEKRRLEMIREYKALQWCDERKADIKHTDSNVIVDIPGFDQIIAETLQQAVQLAVELEQKYTPLVQEELPDWLPSAAELDEIEDDLLRGYEGCYHKDSEKCDCAAQVAVHQAWIESDSTLDEHEWIPSPDELDKIEKSLQAGAQMARDETEVIKAQPINGAYFL